MVARVRRRHAAAVRRLGGGASGHAASADLSHLRKAEARRPGAALRFHFRERRVAAARAVDHGRYANAGLRSPAGPPDARADRVCTALARLARGRLQLRVRRGASRPPRLPAVRRLDRAQPRRLDAHLHRRALPAGSARRRSGTSTGTATPPSRRWRRASACSTRRAAKATAAFCSRSRPRRSTGVDLSADAIAPRHATLREGQPALPRGLGDRASAARRERGRRRLVRDDRAPVAAARDARGVPARARAGRHPRHLVAQSPRVQRRRAASANHYHVRELDRAELAALLAPGFPNQAWYAQRVLAHSAIWAEGAAGDVAPAFLTLAGDRPTRAPAPAPAMYFLVVAAARRRGAARVARGVAVRRRRALAVARLRARAWPRARARVGRARCAQGRRGPSGRARAGDQCARQRAGSRARARSTRIEGAGSGARARRRRRRRRRSHQAETAQAEAVRASSQRDASRAKRRRARRPRARSRASRRRTPTRAARLAYRESARGWLRFPLAAVRQRMAARGADGDRRRRRSGARRVARAAPLRGKRAAGALQDAVRDRRRRRRQHRPRARPVPAASSREQRRALRS